MTGEATAFAHANELSEAAIRRAAQTMALMFDFPLDMARVPTEVNRLSNQVLVNTYEREWGKVEH